MKIFCHFICHAILIVVCAALVGEPRLAFSDSLIDADHLDRYGLTRPWFTQIQMDRGRDRVASVVFDGKLIIVQTKQGMIQAIDGESGDTVWVAHVGNSQLFTSPIGVGPKHVAVVNGSQLFVFDKKNGKLVWNRKLLGGVIGGPGLSEDYVFVPKVDGNLEAYSLDKPKPWKEVRLMDDTQFPVWKYNSHGKTMTRPVVFNQTIGWANDRAHFYVAKLNPMEILFRVEAFDNIVVPPAHINKFLYLASIDGYLYKVHDTTGDIYWRFSTGDSLIHRPVAVDGSIYIATPNGGFYRVLADAEVAKKAKDKSQDQAKNAENSPVVKEGREVWFNPDVSQVLAVTEDKVFGMDNKENIRIIDNKSGKSLGSIPTHGISFPPNESLERSDLSDYYRWVNPVHT